MGSWNGTCGLTNLAIRSRDKIVLFPIQSQKEAETNGSGFTETYRLYSPITVPIHGKYNDYGGIENITKNEKEVYDHLQLLVNNPYQYQKIELIDESRIREKEEDESDCQYLINKIIGRGHYSSLGYMMVLEEAYEKVIERSKTRKEKLLSSIKEFLNAYSLALSSGKSKDDLETCFNLGRELNIQGNLFLRSVSDYDNAFTSFKEILHSLHLKGDSVINSLIDLMVFNSALEDLRKHWCLQSGAGSQEDDYEAVELLSLDIIEISEKRRKEYLE